MEHFFVKMLDVFSEEVKKASQMAYLQGIEDGKKLSLTENIEVNKAYICKNIFRQSYNTCKRYFDDPKFPEQNQMTRLWNKKQVLEYRESVKTCK